MQPRLHLRNTMSRAVEPFVPRNPDRVEIFTCGPSTYRRPHIGNYRTFLYEDILVKHLRYLGYPVHRVINFTDVEDKTLVEAEHQGQSVEEVTREVHDHFYRETELLGIDLPEEIPRSSTSVDQAVEIITTLMEKGHAYRHNGDIFFDPLTKPDFGKLFRLDMSRWPKKKYRFRKDTYPGRRWNLGDFILWHDGGDSSRPDAYWDTALGRGRPAWNIQDPAMILQQIGTQIDINCGGIDNIYRHHDYNIAVMEAYSGKEFARYYLHGEHLEVDGKPMSKSVGNILYPEDLVEQGYEHKHLRFFLFYTHYRKKLNFTDERFAEVSRKLDDFRDEYYALLEAGEETEPASTAAHALIDTIEPIFRESTNDDLAVGRAFDRVAGVLSSLREATGGKGLDADGRSRLEAAMKRIDSVLGVIASN